MEYFAFKGKRAEEEQGEGCREMNMAMNGVYILLLLTLEMWKNLEIDEA